MLILVGEYYFLFLSKLVMYFDSINHLNKLFYYNIIKTDSYAI